MGLSRYYIARQGTFKHVLPSEEEIAKYGKVDRPVNHMGLDMTGMEEKAGRCARVVEEEFPKASPKSSLSF
jgi:hypothetical protein